MFTRQLIEEIKKKLFVLGKSDSLFEETKNLDRNDFFAVVKDGENKKISINDFVDSDGFSSKLQEVLPERLVIYENCTFYGTGDDITIESDSETGRMRIKNRTLADGGMGYIILEPNKSFVNQIGLEDTIYEVRYDFTLTDASIDFPANSVLYFNGGSLKNLNGTTNLVGDGAIFSSIVPKDRTLYNVELTGDWIYNQAEQTQADWEQTDDTAPDYIKNKPEITDFVDRQYNPSEYSGLGRVYLQKNIVNVGGTDKNILTQDAFNKDGVGSTRVPNTNTVFVVPFDFEIGSKRNLEITVSASNISNLTSPNYLGNTGVLAKLEERKRTQDATLAEYEAEKTALEEEKQALIDDDAPQEEIDAVEAQIVAKQNQIDSLKLKIGYEVTGKTPLSDSTINKIADQTTIVSTTPHYYFFASVTIPAHKVLIAKCPGCVFLGNDLVTIISKDVCYGSTTDGVDTIVYVAYMAAATYDFVEDTFISLPENSVLEFDGGSISNGTIKGDHTGIVASPDAEIFKNDIIIKGLWDITEIYDGWFKYDYVANTANNQIIHNILGLTHDDYSSNVHIIQDREYLVELPEVPLILKEGHDVSCSQYNNSSSYCHEVAPSAPRQDIRVGNWGWGPGFEAICIFWLNSNTRYIIDSTIKMLPTGEDYYQLFKISHKENIVIEGSGSIIGDVNGLENAHLYSQYYNLSTNTYFGEQGFIIRANVVKNLTIKDLTFNGSFGDNIYITGGNSDPTTGLYYGADDTEHILPSDGVTITNIRVLYARRNGIAISCRNAIVEGCFFEGNGIDSITGTAPKAGIDFECDQGTASFHAGPGFSIMCNRNVVMDGCVFRNNKNDISSTANRAYGESTIETYIKNCTFTSPIRLNQTAGLQFEDCFIPLISAALPELWYLAASENINFIRCIFENSNIRMLSYTSSDGKYRVTDNIKFVDCIYYNDFAIRDHAYVYAGSTDMPYLRFKVPEPNSDVYTKMTITCNCRIKVPNGQGGTTTTIGIIIIEYDFLTTSASTTQLKCKLISARGTPFNRAYDDDANRPKIAPRTIDGYRYLFISNPNFDYCAVGIEYSFNCCKLTSSTSESSFVQFDIDPSVGIFAETETINRNTVVFSNPLNQIYPGNYGSSASLNQAAQSPFFYNGRVLFPDGTNVRDNDGELYNIRHSGNTSQMPAPTNIGFQYINTGTHMPLWWDGEMFMYGDGVRISAKRAGVTADRPTGSHTEYANPEDPTDISPTQDATHTEAVRVGDLGALSQQGFVYFDTTLGKPVYAKEINSTTGVITWVDATGAPA